MVSVGGHSGSFAARLTTESQRRAYGLRDEEYLKLKILTASLPEL
jgi:hypothetical protein